MTDEDIERIAEAIARKLCEPERAAAFAQAVMNAPITEMPVLELLRDGALRPLKEPA